MITFDSESSLLLAPYLTHLMRMNFKFLNPIPMKQVFLSISNHVAFIHLFSISQTMGCKLLGNLTTPHSYTACTAQMYQGDVKVKERVGWPKENARI